MTFLLAMFAKWSCAGNGPKNGMKWGQRTYDKSQVYSCKNLANLHKLLWGIALDRAIINTPTFAQKGGVLRLCGGRLNRADRA